MWPCLKAHSFICSFVHLFICLHRNWRPFPADGRFARSWARISCQPTNNLRRLRASLTQTLLHQWWRETPLIRRRRARPVRQQHATYQGKQYEFNFLSFFASFGWEKQVALKLHTVAVAVAVVGLVSNSHEMPFDIYICLPPDWLQNRPEEVLFKSHKCNLTSPLGTPTDQEKIEQVSNSRTHSHMCTIQRQRQ